MDHPPPRTHTTFLTDDDLLIYDFLTKGCVSISCLRQDDYSFHMNCGYTHGLSDAQLIDRIHDLAQLRLLTYQPAGRQQRIRYSTLAKSQPRFAFRFPNSSISFNIDGGQLWEAERAPDWQRHIWWLPAKQGVITIAGLNQSILDDFLRVSHSTGRFNLHSPAHFEEHRQLSLDLFYTQRLFANVVTASAACEFPDPNEIHKKWNMLAYKRARTWWTEINAPPVT